MAERGSRPWYLVMRKNRWANVVRWMLALSLVSASGVLSGHSALAFELEDVTAMAARLAAQPFQAPQGQVPEWLLNITYDQWRDIRFRPQRALWRDERLPFQVQFFHPGLYYDRTVAINVVEGTVVRP